MGMAAEGQYEGPSWGCCACSLGQCQSLSCEIVLLFHKVFIITGGNWIKSTWKTYNGMCIYNSLKFKRFNKTKQRTFGLSAWDLNFLVSDSLCLNTRVCTHSHFMGKRKDFSVFLHFICLDFSFFCF